jgi:TRAP-type C4-dicarboxylate transport system substrate-binding protein
MTPADMAGIKLRMPGGDAWQFLGQALGANPTPMAYAEVYTGLQTGAIDGQDNPLPNVQNMKFYEVMSQIVLTSHLVGYDLLTISRTAWDAMTPEQQEKVQAAATAAIDWSQAEHLKREAELVATFEADGLLGMVGLDHRAAPERAARANRSVVRRIQGSNLWQRRRARLSRVQRRRRGHRRR